MNEFTYKSRQENILIEYICSSKLTTKEILNDIKEFYNNNPYHNFLHALQVSSNVLLLSLDDFSILELRTLIYAGLFHDAMHKGKLNVLDEFISYSIAYDYLNKNIDKVGEIDFIILRKAIIGTVFKNRGKYTDKYSILLGDLDILSIGIDIYTQIYYGDILCFELGIPIEKWVSDFSFYKNTLKISKKIFISPYILKSFPNSINVIGERLKIPKDVLISMLKVLRDEDITLAEFRERFKNI